MLVGLDASYTMASPSLVIGYGITLSRRIKKKSKPDFDNIRIKGFSDYEMDR